MINRGRCSIIRDSREGNSAWSVEATRTCRLTVPLPATAEVTSKSWLVPAGRLLKAARGEPMTVGWLRQVKARSVQGVPSERLLLLR